MEKKKVSAFEFVFMQASEPEKAKKYEPFTKEEELKQREENLKEQASKIRITKDRIK